MRLFRTVVVLIPFLMACASKPEAQIETAEQALQSARDAEADVYADQKYQQAEQTLQSARQEIAAQDEKFAFSRDYTQAAELLQNATVQAQEAAAGVETRKQEVRQQAESAREAARQALDDAGQALAKAPMGKGSRADIQALRSDLDFAESAFRQAEGELSSGDLMSALQQFQQAKSRAESVSSQIPRRR